MTCLTTGEGFSLVFLVFIIGLMTGFIIGYEWRGEENATKRARRLENNPKLPKENPANNDGV